MEPIKIEYIINTVQGEGRWCGTPATLVRTFGCPVSCPWCDTGYGENKTDHGYAVMELAEILTACRERHVMITGGEPMIHRQLPEICEALIEAGKFVQIETSGAFWQDVPDDVWVTFSPKDHCSSYKSKPQFWARANEVKVVISDGREMDFYGEKLKSFKGEKLFQPEYERRQWSTPLCVQLAREYGGRLSIQAHKLLGLP